MFDKRFLQAVASLVDDANGAAMPDGDPIDQIQNQFPDLARQYGYDVRNDSGYITISDWDDDVDPPKHIDMYMMDVLDLAFKDEGGYYQHLSNVWNSVAPDLNLGPSPWTESQIIKGQIRIEEALDDYDSSLIQQISEITGRDETEIEEIKNKLSLARFLDLAMAVKQNDTEEVKKIVNRHAPEPEKKSKTPESLVTEMRYLIKKGVDNVILPELKYMTESDQRYVLAEMNSAELQKILANLRGYKYPGMYESSIFSVQMNEEIIKLLKENKIKSYLNELVGARPGEQQRATAYGSAGDNQPASTQKASKGKTAKFKNDQGQDEEGEVVAQDDRFVTIKTSKGLTKRIPIAQAMVNEEELATIIRLAGLKK